MSKQSEYTAEEWKTIVSAPLAAGLLVSLADLSSPVGMAKEAVAVFEGIVEPLTTSSNELIKTIAEGWKAQTFKPDLPDLPRDSPDSARRWIIDLCKQAAAIVSQKSPDEADEYNRWLVSLARKTAEASKEGGFLGIGGTLVSDSEKAAVDELVAALGVQRWQLLK
jgi:hypothetical protein